MTDYNNHKLFIWNENNLLISNNSNLYENVYIHTGTVFKYQWENSISCLNQNDELKIISNSNHFLHGRDMGEGYNCGFKIYNNIIRNFYETKSLFELEKQQTDSEIVLDKKESIYEKFIDNYYDDKIYFNCLDAFSFSNSGHNLSVMLSNVDYIIKNNIKDILMFENYDKTNNYELILKILPKDCNIHFLKINKIYKFKKLIVIHPCFFNMYNKSYLIEELKNNIINNYSHTYKDYERKNIILMKTNRNKNVMNPYTSIICEELLLELEKNNYINIIPEEMNIFQLALYLIHANKIIFSEGSVLFTNQIFFNPKAKCIYLTNNTLISADVSCNFQNPYISRASILQITYNKNNLTEIMDKILNF